MNLAAMMNETDHSTALCGDRLAKLLVGKGDPARIQSAQWVTLDLLRRVALADPR